MGIGDMELRIWDVKSGVMAVKFQVLGFKIYPNTLDHGTKTLYWGL